MTEVSNHPHGSSSSSSTIIWSQLLLFWKTAVSSGCKYMKLLTFCDDCPHLHPHSCSVVLASFAFEFDIVI